MRATEADGACESRVLAAPPPLRRADAGGASSPAALAGAELPPGLPCAVDVRDACLYALGVGAGRQPGFAGGAERRRVAARPLRARRGL